MTKITSAVMVAALLIAIKPTQAAHRVKHHKPVSLITKHTKQRFIQIQQAVTQASHRYGVPRRLILAVIEKESTYKPHSQLGDNVGLMQISTRSHGKLITSKDWYSITKNVMVGTSLLKNCMQKHGNQYEAALSCYNRSHDASQYSKRVMQLYYTSLTITQLEQEVLG